MRLLLSFILILFAVVPTWATEILDSQVPQVVVQAPLNENTNVVITAAELPETSPEQIETLLNDPKTQGADILVSTDQQDVVEAVSRATAKTPNRLLRFIPIGQLAQARDHMAQSFSHYYHSARNTIMHDRIGLTVLTITTGYDSMIWIHSASLDMHQKTAMVMMNLVMAATFGLDRDLWTRTVTPLKHKLMRTFDRFIVTERLNTTKTLTSQFLANLSLAFGVQVARVGLLSLEHLSTAATTTEFWMKAAQIAGLSTLTGFAWTEMFGAINAQRNPVAKMMMKRIGETRGLIMAHLASISMVLQPEIYGNTPVIAYVVHGAIGLIALANAHRIVNWLENNSTVRRIFKKVESFENFINGGLQAQRRQQRPPNVEEPTRREPVRDRAPARPVIRSCRALFA